MKMKKKCAVLFTGGKDSCLALHKAKQDGYEIAYLLTVMPDSDESYMFHKPDLALLEKQAEMLDIKLIIRNSKGEKEKELEDLKKLISVVKNKVDAVVIGGIASSYQGSRIRRICDKLGLEFYAPLLGYDAEEIWDELISEGFKVILTKISCEGLPYNMLGKVIDNKVLNRLKKLSKEYGFRIDFEGGEAETAVLDMLEFKKEIKIKFNIKSQGPYNAVLDIKKIK